MNFIVTHDTYFTEHTPQDRENTIRALLASKGIRFLGNRKISDSAAPVVPFVNNGRWLARCPDCGASHLAREDELFMCCDCGNHACNQEYRQAPFPKNRVAIERILLARPRSGMRHWTTETIKELEAENRVHGHPAIG